MRCLHLKSYWKRNNLKREHSQIQLKLLKAKKMKHLIYISLCLILFSHCVTKSALVLDNNFNPKKAETQSYEITGHTLKGDMLKLNISYKGCKNDTFELKANGMYLKTNPPKLPLALSHTSSGDCDMSLNKTLSFDVSKAKYPGDLANNVVTLTLKDYPEIIDYIYK